MAAQPCTPQSRHSPHSPHSPPRLFSRRSFHARSHRRPPLSLLASLFSTPAFGQGVAMSNGDFVGTVRVGAMCVEDSRTCIAVKNDDEAYPMEVISVSYVSARGQVLIESPPVIDGRLQCVFTGDRPCTPVLTPGERGAMELPGPVQTGQLISVRLRLLDTPGSEADLPETVVSLAEGNEVLLIGDLAAYAQAAAVTFERREIRLGPQDRYANYNKGTKY